MSISKPKVFLSDEKTAQVISTSQKTVDYVPLPSIDQRISLIRAIACLLVITIHVSSANFPQFSDRWASSVVFDSISRCSVPLFFMVSGAMLLDREETLLTFYRKRLLRILPPIIFWSMSYLWWLETFNSFHSEGWIRAILRGPVIYHFWYFYTIIGIYFIVPVLRKFFKHTTSRGILLSIATWFVVVCLFQTVSVLFGWVPLHEKTYIITNILRYCWYLVLGAYLYKRPAPASTWPWLVLFVVGGAITALATKSWSLSVGKPHELFFEYYAPFVVISAIGLFNACLSLKITNHRVAAAIKVLSDCSLGIYCVHIMVKDELRLRYGLSALIGNPWVTTPVTVLAVAAISLVIIYVARLIRPLRWIT